MTSDQEAAQLQQKFALRLAGDRQPEVSGNVLQELSRRQPAVKDVGIGHVASLEQLQQAPNQERLPSTDLPGHDHEAFALPNAIVERRQRLVMSPGGK